MNTALLYFTLHLIEAEIDRKLDSPYIENCVQIEEREMICMKEFLNGPK